MFMDSGKKDLSRFITFKVVEILKKAKFLLIFNSYI